MTTAASSSSMDVFSTEPTISPTTKGDVEDCWRSSGGYYWRTNYEGCEYGNDESANDKSKGQGDAGTLAILSVVFFVITLLVIRAIRTHRTYQQNTRVAARQEASRRRAEEQTPSNSQHKMSLDDRKEFVSTLLKTAKYEAPEDDDTSVSSGSDEDKEDAKQYQEMCAICLDEFEEGDDVCSSQTKNCQHMFHHVCAYEWLMRHDACPVCRRDYISTADESVQVSLTHDRVPVSTPSTTTAEHQESIQDIENGSGDEPEPVAQLAIRDGSEFESAVDDFRGRVN